MSTLVTFLHVIVCLFLMLTVLLQSGKGGGMGAAFGGGNAATVFGGSGASGFLQRLTAVAGTIFMITSMVLAFISSHNSADALEKWGEKQQQIADEKERAKTEGLQGGSGAGSASLTPFTPAPAGSAAPAPVGAEGPASMSPPLEVPGGSAAAPGAPPPVTMTPVTPPAVPAEQPAAPVTPVAPPASPPAPRP